MIDKNFVLGVVVGVVGGYLFRHWQAQRAAATAR